MQRKIDIIFSTFHSSLLQQLLLNYNANYFQVLHMWEPFGSLASGSRRTLNNFYIYITKYYLVRLGQFESASLIFLLYQTYSRWERVMLYFELCDLKWNQCRPPKMLPWSQTMKTCLLIERASLKPKQPLKSS